MGHKRLKWVTAALLWSDRATLVIGLTSRQKNPLYWRSAWGCAARLTARQTLFTVGHGHLQPHPPAGGRRGGWDGDPAGGATGGKKDRPEIQHVQAQGGGVLAISSYDPWLLRYPSTWLTRSEAKVLKVSSLWGSRYCPFNPSFRLESRKQAPSYNCSRRRRSQRI